MTIRVNWGAGVAAAYATFATGTVAFVIFAMGKPVDLVRTDYYAASMRQDERMRAVENARRLATPASVHAEGGQIVVTAPAGAAATARGTITLYRASDPDSDRIVPFALDGAGRQRIPTAGLLRGRWTVQVAWRVADRDFYFERPVDVP